MRARLRHTQRGFTLTELMVVIAVIGVISALVFSVSSKPYGANPQNFAEELVQTMNLGKMRAVSTRKYHRVTVTGPSAGAPYTASYVQIWQWSNTGMKTPSGTCDLGPPIVDCWQLVQQYPIPSGVVAHAGSTSVAAVAGSVSPTVDAALAFDIDFRPDGSSTGGTVFLADRESLKPWRVVVYRATGSSYARETW